MPPVVVNDSVSTITSPDKPVVSDDNLGKEMAQDDTLSTPDKTERANILVKKAEFLGTNNEYNEALSLFERALHLTPSSDIERKLAHMAFKAKRFQRSADLYKKNVDVLTLSEKQEFMNALRYTSDDDFSVALSNLRLPDYMQQAFQVSWTCENEFISCESAIRAYKYDYDVVTDLQAALNNYANLSNKDDENYKEALLI